MTTKQQVSTIKGMPLHLLLASITGLGFGVLAYLSISSNHPWACVAFLCLAGFSLLVDEN